MSTNCEGNHRFFVAETGSVEAEGKVFVVIVCTACGKTEFIQHQAVGNVQFNSNKGGRTFVEK